MRQQLSALQAQAQPYYFNLDTATFDELRRQSGFRWAGQERLSRQRQSSRRATSQRPA